MKEIYLTWLKNCEQEQELYQELIAIKDLEGEVSDRFFRELAFGTGGLRGKIGAGTNRMNIYSVGRVTRGLAKYILNNGIKKSVVIAYDSRNKSKEFATIVSQILSQNGIEAYLFSELMPTPVLSFAVRKLQAGMGIVITASHNPKAYNGYKVYNENGCQITDLVAQQISAEIEKCSYFDLIVANDEKIHLLGDEILNEFLLEIRRYSFLGQINDAPKIVYTPLNGTGNVPIKKLFQVLGIDDYLVVPQQENPDANFTTCPRPNPEEKDALLLAIELAKKEGAELVIATDPDADRVGIAVRDGADFTLLNGNETGVLLAEYIFENLTQSNKMPDKAYMVKTIVTTDLVKKIACKYSVSLKEVLTGFKYIGETIDCAIGENYVYGMEESYGYLVGTHARDKDAISAVMSIVEMVTYYKRKGLSLIEKLNDIYETYGYYTTSLYSKTFEGQSGMFFMESFMKDLRENPLTEVCGKKIIQAKDYVLGLDGLPKSNVISFFGEDFSLIIRPSGTEPKMKVYITAQAETKKDSLTLLGALEQEVENLLDKN